ncbi:allophanate hydrolase subunit 1 [Bradyrhizobium sp. IAR9]|uniref:5-oxoprolinase subunit B family protein n=1 Tax=Bradyrhizobium sp. IAR9 TaxID=2663841 RepID=UPI0015C91B4D
MTDAFPRYRPVAERAVLVEFGEAIDKAIHDRVLLLDAALASAPFEGFVEAVPAYASLLVCFNPIATDHRTVREEVAALLARAPARCQPGVLREVDVCYDADLAPDLERVAEASGLTPEQVVEAHLSGEYRVFMYGFAPGYAYLAGVPEVIQVPRKQAAVRDIPAGSVLIAGPQCLVTTLKMPTGWWMIGRSPTRILDVEARDRPFLFDVGDRVQFRRISRAALEGAPL